MTLTPLIQPPARFDDRLATDIVTLLRHTLNAELIGKEQVVEFVIAAVLARGHLLLEDVPGLGKTTLAKALAHSVGGEFKRVQCTPDLLPGDITGFSVFNQKSREFDFLPGPVFADVLMVDEINRATPRTQSALLEAMAERQVTVDNVHHPLSESFFVIATQNPVDYHGTHPLPEAQLDRFAMKLTIGYPGAAHEATMLASAVGDCCRAPALGKPVLTPHLLHALQQKVASVAVNEKVQHYLVALAQASRAHAKVALGVSPRGLLVWQRVAQAWAYLAGRTFVTPDDVQVVAGPVLSVRLSIDARESAAVIHELLRSVAVPSA